MKDKGDFYLIIPTLINNENNNDEFLSGLSTEAFAQLVSDFFKNKTCLPCISNVIALKFDINKLLETYYLLNDDYSKDMFVKIIIYRLTSGKNYELPQKDIFCKLYSGEINTDIDTCFRGEDLQFSNRLFNLFDLEHIGYNIKVYSSKLIIFVELILNQYGYEKGNVKFEITPGDYIIDGGACSGDTALYFAHKTGENGKVFSFEFLPDNLELFHKNLNLNPQLKERIQLVPNALWEDSTSNLFVFGDGTGTWCSQVEFNGYSMRVPTKSIDDFVKEENIEKVDFIKLDIEGSELSCLHGARETIQKFKPKLAICVYHKDIDFTTIPQYIKKIVPEYNLYLDHYSELVYETILYAII